MVPTRPLIMISKHISYKEGVYSTTATRRGIDNEPDDEQLANMELIAEKVFEPLREYVGGPIKINSFFRSVKLNKAIGGSSKSQHCKGQGNLEMMITLIGYMLVMFLKKTIEEGACELTKIMAKLFIILYNKIEKYGILCRYEPSYNFNCRGNKP